LDPENTGPGAAPAAPPRAATRPPKIDSVVFARKSEALQGSLEVASLSRLLSAGVEPRGTLLWEVNGSVARDELKRQRELLRVRTTFSPWMTCSRCLEAVEVAPLQTDTTFRLAASEEQAAVEDREAEEVEVIAASPHLDLAALVEDEAILALPMAPVHAACEWKVAPATDSPGDV
jgi:uncharacterized protein